MPSLRVIKRKIRSIKKTQQVTKAMKMISAVKMKRAQDKLTDVFKCHEIAEEFIVSLSNDCSSRVLSPYIYIIDRPFQRTTTSFIDRLHLNNKKRELNLGVFVVSGDRGLAGSFNINILRRISRLNQEIDELRLRKSGADIQINIDYIVHGEKAFNFLKKKGCKVVYHSRLEKIRGEELFESLLLNSMDIRDFIMQNFIDRPDLGASRLEGSDRKYDGYIGIYNHFVSMVELNVREEMLLPILIEKRKGVIPGYYLFEDERREFVKAYVKRHILGNIIRILLDSYMSEQVARMNAMESATKNAEDMIERLAMLFNKARQSSITKELIDIITGVEVIKTG